MDAEYDACGIGGAVVFADLGRAVRGADDASADGVALGDFGCDDGEGRPVGYAPGDADCANEDRGAECGADDEGEEHQDGEGDVAEDPGAA